MSHINSIISNVIVTLNQVNPIKIIVNTSFTLIAETAVWPNFFLMNVFFALKESKLSIIIYFHKNTILCKNITII